MDKVVMPVQGLLTQYLVQIILGTINIVLGILCKHLYSKLKKQSEESEARLKKKEEDDELTRKGVLVTLHMRLYELCQRCIDKRNVTTEELKNAEEVYDTYHSLGGNGTGTALYKKILELPIDND